MPSSGAWIVLSCHHGKASLTESRSQCACGNARPDCLVSIRPLRLELKPGGRWLAPNRKKGESLTCRLSRDNLPPAHWGQGGWQAASESGNSYPRSAARPSRDRSPKS